MAERYPPGRPAPTRPDPPSPTDDDEPQSLRRFPRGEDRFGYTAPTTTFGPTVRRLADLEPATIECMHGSSLRGDGGAHLHLLADTFEERFGT